MAGLLHVTWFGTRETLSRPTYVIFFVFWTLAMSVLLVLIPVWAVPDNTISIQLAIMTPRDWALLTLLSSLSSLYMAMQTYVFRHRRSVVSAGAAFGGGAGALFAGVAGMAFCASCLAPFFALFGIGLGAVLFTLQYRWYVVAAVTVLMVVAIYLTARKIGRVCTSC